MPLIHPEEAAAIANTTPGVIFALAALAIFPAAALTERLFNRKRTTAEKERDYATIRAKYVGIAGLSRDHRPDRDQQDYPAPPANHP